MRSSLKTITLWAFAAFLLAGCATNKASVVPEVVWPLPPDDPRVRFVKSITDSTDVAPVAKSISMLDTLIGGSGSTTGFNKPYDVHVDDEGRLFVADTGWGKVLVFDYPAESFWILGVDGRGLLAQPVGVTTDPSGRIYVTDSAQARVVVYDRDGNYLNAFGGRDYMIKPVGLVVDAAADRIYVVDTKLHRVVVFDTAGNFISNFGDHGPEDGRFNWPTNISIGPDGNLYVVDMLNFRVQVFNTDGEFLWKFGGVGRGFGQFSKPKGISLSKEGYVFVSDAAFNNVQIFDSKGRLLLFFGGMGGGPGQFWMPAGLTVTKDGKVYVADQFNRRVNVYQLLDDPLSTTTEDTSVSGP
jgi:DNA-binding beta-propeller fold protein YncE